MRRILLKGLSAAAAALLVVSFSLADVHAKDPAKGKAKVEAAAGAKVDINSASQAELEKLPGVGAVSAKKSSPADRMPRLPTSRRRAFRPEPSKR